MRVLHDKYVRSNRKLSVFGLHNFHVSLVYETIEMRSSTVCRSPFFFLTVSVYDLIPTLAHHSKGAHNPVEPNIISSMTSNLHRQKDIAIIEESFRGIEALILSGVVV